MKNTLEEHEDSVGYTCWDLAWVNDIQPYSALSSKQSSSSYAL